MEDIDLVKIISSDSFSYVIKEGLKKDKNDSLSLSLICLYMELIKLKKKEINIEVDTEIFQAYYRVLSEIYFQLQDLNNLRIIYKRVNKYNEKIKLPEEFIYNITYNYCKILISENLFGLANDIFQKFDKSATNKNYPKYEKISKDINDGFSNFCKAAYDNITADRTRNELLKTFNNNKLTKDYIINISSTVPLQEYLMNFSDENIRKEKLNNINNFELISNKEYYSFSKDSKFLNFQAFYPLGKNSKNKEYFLSDKEWQNFSYYFYSTNIIDMKLSDETKNYFFKIRFIMYENSFNNKNYHMLSTKYLFLFKKYYHNTSIKGSEFKSYFENVIKSNLRKDKTKTYTIQKVFKLKDPKYTDIFLFKSMLCFAKNIKFLVPSSYFDEIDFGQHTIELSDNEPLFLVYLNNEDLFYKKEEPICSNPDCTERHNKHTICSECDNSTYYCSENCLENDSQHKAYHEAFRTIFHEELKQGLIGIKKIGNNSFINAVLQCFLHCKEFALGLINNNEGYDANLMTKSLIEFSKKMWKQEELKIINPLNFVNYYISNNSNKGNNLSTFMQFLFKHPSNIDFNLFKVSYSNYKKCKNNHDTEEAPIDQDYLKFKAYKLEGTETPSCKYITLDNQINFRTVQITKGMKKNDFLIKNDLKDEHCSIVKFENNGFKIIEDNNNEIISNGCFKHNKLKYSEISEEIILYEIKKDNSKLNFLVIPVYENDFNKLINYRKIGKNLYTNFNGENINDLTIQSYPFYFSADNSDVDTLSQNIFRYIYNNDSLKIKAHPNKTFSKSQIPSKLELKYLFEEEFKTGKLIKLYFNLYIKEDKIFEKGQFEKDKNKTEISSFGSPDYKPRESSVQYLFDNLNNFPHDGNDFKCNCCGEKIVNVKYIYKTFSKYLIIDFENSNPYTKLTVDGNLMIKSTDQNGQEITNNFKLICAILERGDKEYEAVCKVDDNWYEFFNDKVNSLSNLNFEKVKMVFYEKSV